MKTLEQFLSDYLGKSKGYPEGQYVGECLSVCKLYIKECFGINPPPSGTNSAYGYWTNFPSPLGTVFEKIENNPDLIPQKGWIVIWKPWTTNKYGHIAIIKDGNLNTFNSYDQNWGTKIFKEINHNYDNVVGFLKPKQSIIEDMISEEQKRILDFLTGKTEGDVRQAFGALADIESKDKQIQTLQSRVLDLEKSQKDLEDRIVALESNIQADLGLIEKLKLDNKNQLIDITTKNKTINELQNIKKIEELSIGEVFEVLIGKIFKK